MEARSNDPKSKMAVLLHADVADSTSMVQLDERLAHRRITETLRHFAAVIQSYGGVAHEVRGDALVAEFSRASDAVSAALAFQQLNRRRNEEISDDIVPRFRVGIALGEVIVADATVTGAGLVVAQRAEQLAQPDGIVITGAINEALPRRLPFLKTDLGEKRLKGFDDPLRLHAVDLAEGADVPLPSEGPVAGRTLSSRSTVLAVLLLLSLVAVGIGGYKGFVGGFTDTLGTDDKLPRSDKPSLAVLPFDNMSEDASQAYFVDGITEDLITDLSKVSGLMVIARNSSFSYKGMMVDLRQVAKELGVRYVLEGSVRRLGTTVRINAQLVNGADGTHVWADRYDREITDVFALQDEVTRSIVNALSVELTDSERKRFGELETTSIEAYEVRLKALEIQSRFTPNDNAEGRALYEQAARIDPRYARAWAGVGLTHAIDLNMNWSSDRDRSIRLGLDAIDRALELDDTVVRAYFAKAAMLLAQRRYEEAELTGKRVIELEPNYADGHAQLAFILANTGKHEEALVEITQAYQLNPKYSQIYMYVEGIALFMAARYTELVVLLERSLERNPAFDRVHMLLASAYGHLGRVEDAEWTIAQVLTIRPGLTIRAERENLSYKRSEDIDRYVAGLRLAGFPEG